MNRYFDTPFYVLRATTVDDPNSGQSVEKFVALPKKHWGNFQEEDKSKRFQGHATVIDYSHILICDVIDVLDPDRIQIAGEEYFIRQVVNPANRNHHLEIPLQKVV